MLVIAHHNISNPEAFWKAAKEETQNLPVSLKIHGIYPSNDKKSATCLWEADNVEQVDAFLETHTGKFAKNFCYEVDVKEAMGLPAIKMEEAHAI